jgi:hypothetical protein
MTLLPKHPASRRVAALWLLACLATLVVMLLRPGLYEGDRNALSTLVPLYWLSLPLGHVGVLAGIDIRTALYVAGTAPGIPAEGLFMWLVLAVLGYVQWFLLLPLIARKCQQLLQFLFNRDAANDRPAR